MNTTKSKVHFDPLKGWEGSICTEDEIIAEMVGPHPNSKGDGALIVAAWNAAREINAENPIAAAESMPEIWRLLKEALPIIEREADTRDVTQYTGDNDDLRQYYREMRDLTERIEALILKARALEAA